MLTDKCIVVGVTGGIAAYKACELVSRLIKQGADVRVIMTKNATEFVQPLTFQSLSHNPVSVDTFANIQTWEIEHVALAQRADLFIIAPATANVMAKLACGIADDMLTTTVLATHAPVLLAPAMNTGMWENPATQHNLEVLVARGVHIAAPGTGLLACGTTGAGRMSEPVELVEAANALLKARADMAGLSVVVTAGPTAEPIDPVRFITNRSSGRMGYALAEAARARGANVTLISGPTALKLPAGVDVVRISTTRELHDAVLAHADADVIIQAAAPADFRVREYSDKKIKRTGDTLTLELEPNPDIAAELGQLKRPGQTLVGFAAETNDVNANARDKLRRKSLDLIVANDVTRAGAGFDVDTNIVTLIDEDEMRELPIMSKRDVADRVLDHVLKLRARG
ncbi:MAG TPA: bifunctional phosphopantothenoylcysteine decarboxylase/phosphopantothenate--cysteine ligase CoaBC [Candidatus Fimadaptatus faecigallinarum]|uniref:Coenzyme A biosynthesis bifunctional protein CoaBC n=1 Tax=Candidatus Fimadaptatus faecigallinarum TaxID=2840814 RepID=A0A9D1LQ02_9FIRM|nr:bifunctional phosphopantothenoylcysteine decarboxylase/phosphopantothenate--cysteine ligase CoaBC [Candidatus Fimadaptatus faecigallinarum]